MQDAVSAGAMAGHTGRITKTTPAGVRSIYNAKMSTRVNNGKKSRSVEGGIGRRTLRGVQAVQVRHHELRIREFRRKII